MSQIPVRPVASPVNTFAPGEVRANQRDEVAQLASALEPFSESLDRFARFDARRRQEEGQQQAQTELDERGIRNREQYRKAVEAGEIDENDNPWKISYMRGLIRRNEVREAAARFQAEYDQSQELKSLTYQDLDARISEVLSGPIGNAKAFENQFAMPVAQKLRESLLASHLTQQRQQVQERTQAELQADLGAVLSSNSSENAIPQVQDIADRFSEVMPPPAVRNAIFSAAVQQAQAAKSPELLREILSQVSLEGKTLDYGQDAIIQQRENQIEDAIASDEDRRYRQQRRAEQERLRADYTALSEAAATGDPAIVKDAFGSIDRLGLSPESLTNLRVAYRRSLEEAAESRFDEIIADGEITSDEQVSLQRVYAMIGKPVSEAAAMLQNFRNAPSIQRSDTDQYELIIRETKDLGPEAMIRRIGELEAEGLVTEEFGGRVAAMAFNQEFQEGNIGHYRYYTGVTENLRSQLALSIRAREGTTFDEAMSAASVPFAEWNATAVEIMTREGASSQDRERLLREAYEDFRNKNNLNTPAEDVAYKAERLTLEGNFAASEPETWTDYEFDGRDFFYVGRGAKDDRERIPPSKTPLFFDSVREFAYIEKLDGVLSSVGIKPGDTAVVQSFLLKQASLFDRRNGLSVEGGIRRSAQAAVRDMLDRMARGEDPATPAGQTTLTNSTEFDPGI